MLNKIEPWLQLLRIRHWVKNAFVFIPVLFANRQEGPILWRTLALAAVFCLAASLVYILNDWWDREDDRAHPTKCKRPLASGIVSSRQAAIVAGVIAILLALTLYKWPVAAPYILAYLLLNLSYTGLLKQIAIVDVAVIGLGFVLRVIAGGYVNDIYVSEWLITIVFLLCTALALAKRRHDLALLRQSRPEVEKLREYTLPFLDLALTIMLSITLLAYIIYSLSPAVADRLGTDKLYLTSFFVLLGILRYLLLTLSEQQSGSPVELIWRDRILQVTILLWGLTFYGLVYF